MLRIAEEWHGSDLGRQRQGNEDSYYVRSPLFVVADGMGGARAGEVASEMAVESFGRGIPDAGTPGDGLVEIIADANRRIHERSRADEQHAGMGTTVTAAYVGEREVTIAHVGDSRAYLLRGGDLIRLTRDHSLVGELVARGKLTEEQAEAHPQRSVITRALGSEPQVQVDVEVYPARAGDLFLVCSDGLTSMVHEPRLKPMLDRSASLEEIGRSLIAAANEAGGRDNITVILFRLEDVEPGASASLDAETTEYETLGGAAAPSEQSTQTHSVALAPARPRAQPIEERRPPRSHPRPPRRRRRRIRVGAILATCVVVGVLIAAWEATREVYFVGTDPKRADAVTLYRGLPYDLPFGVRLYSPVLSTGVTLAMVPADRRKTFTDHQWRSRKDAIGLLVALTRGRLQ